jgi:hypothetical protein
MFLDVNGVRLHALSSGMARARSSRSAGGRGAGRCGRSQSRSFQPPAGVASLTTTAAPGSRR